MSQNGWIGLYIAVMAASLPIAAYGGLADYLQKKRGNTVVTVAAWLYLNMLIAAVVAVFFLAFRVVFL